MDDWAEEDIMGGDFRNEVNSLRFIKENFNQTLK